MSASYYPLAIWLQRVDDFGVPAGEPAQTMNLELVHAQTTDCLTNPRYIKYGDVDAHFKGFFIVQEREWTDHRNDGYNCSRSLTIYVRERS